MKKIIDVKNELQAPQASIRFTQPKPKPKPKLKVKVSDIPGTLLTCESSRRALKELISDISFVSGHKVSALIAFETLLHFWLEEIRRDSRMAVALKVNDARMKAHKSRTKRVENINDEYEVIADRLLNALSKSQAADEVVPSV